MRPIHLRIPRFEGVRLWRASRLASWTIMPLLLTSTAPMVQAAQSVTDQTAQGVVLQVGKLGRWPGPARITRELSPIEVTIENRGGVPVLLTYARLQLRGTPTIGQARHAAL